MTAQVNYQKKQDPLAQNLGAIGSLAGNLLLPGIGGAVGGAAGGMMGQEEPGPAPVQTSGIQGPDRMQAIQEMIERQSRERQLMSGMSALKNQPDDVKQAFGPMLQTALSRVRGNGGNV